MILLDTHVLVWLDQGSELLGTRARRLIEEAYQREEIAISAVSFWEIAMLVEQGRLAFEGDLAEWRVSLLNTGMVESPADGQIALAASRLGDFPGDAIDRLIYATAMTTESSLVTADNRLQGRRGVRTINGLR